MSTNSVCQLNITVGNCASLDDAWDRFVEDSPESTIFHTSGWQRVLERSYPYRPHLLAARRGERVCGALPLYRVRTLPFGHSLVSVPMGVYGGCCAEDDEVRSALLLKAREIANDLGVRFLELRNERAVSDLPVKDLYYTFRREIFASEDENMALIPRNQRRSIRIGKKNELEARLGGAELLDGFYDVYSHSVRNHGSPVYARSYFANLLDVLGERCRILGVYKDGALLSAVMTFLFKDQVMPYYAGAYRHGLKLGVYDFMYWSLMCHGAESGFKVFDFGRSKKETGSFDFKRHWGFEPTPLAYQYDLVRQSAMPDLSPANPKLSLPIRIWRKLPLRVTQILGPQLVKFFP